MLTIERPSGELPTSVDLDGVVGPALARAPVLTAEAQRWQIVEQVRRGLGRNWTFQRPSWLSAGKRNRIGQPERVTIPA